MAVAAVSIRKIKDSVPVRRMITIFLLVVAWSWTRLVLSEKVHT
jgi:hypothetical protein